MERPNYTTDRGAYNTAINVIGGLKDCSVIFKAIDSHFTQSDSLKELVNQRNEFNLRTEKSRTRIEREVRKAFLQFKSEEHQNLVQGIFTERVPLQDKELVLVWQFALNNRLFREISSRVFAKTYYSGRASISKEDITAYLKDFLRQNESLGISWSENTINTLSTKYLNLMSKLGFLPPGRIKSFKHIRPSSEAQVLLLYFAKLLSPKASNILENELLPISFIPSKDVQDRLKKLSLNGFFNMNFNGAALNIELTHSYKGFSSAQYSSFDSVLGRPIYEYLNKYFFAELSNHLNMFPNLPKTPFIWHLSSGPNSGFDCYIIIYKWSRDKLMRLRSVYIEHRERALVNRQSDLSGNESADAQNEKDRIFRQLKEIEAFKAKIDELLAEGYNPILDDGVGKNIAPLQKKKMIPYEVLNAGQLKKYFNADW